MSLNKVVLVRQGALYSPKYVSLLTEQIQTFTDAQIITLTDQDDTPGEVRPLKHNLKGWWAKLELFAPENRDLRPFLFLDLDTYVLGPIDHLFGGQRFTMVRDFLGCCPANSSVMWVPENCYQIWAEFSQCPGHHIKEAGTKGDQFFLGKFAQHLWEDEIKSYRKDCLDGPKGSVIQFHGKPKPHDANGWAGDIWKGS